MDSDRGEAGKAPTEGARNVTNEHGEQMLGTTATVLQEVLVERRRQDEKWGVQNHPDVRPQFEGLDQSDRCRIYEIKTARDAITVTEEAAENGLLSWPDILLEETSEAIEATVDPEALRRELIQVAAVAVAWIESIDRRT
jgi:hypothetical protein